MADAYCRALGLDRVLFIPTGTPPHKHCAQLPEGSHRCAMVQLAIADMPQYALCDAEQYRAGRSYTVDTLLQLREQYPQDSFYLLMGGDMFLTVQDWHGAQKIFELAEVCTLARDAHSHAELLQHAQHLRAMGARAQVIQASVLECSSTEIRAKLAEGCRDAAALQLPQRVLDYLWQNGLYGTDPETYPWPVETYRMEAKRLESPKRFRHSENVAERAAELGERYGVSPKLLYIAGLLHDICKDLPREEQLHWLSKSVIIKDKNILQVPPIWHGPCAAVYIWEELGVYNRQICSAVHYHTTGSGSMSLFDKLIYLADLTSRERDYPDARETHALADHDVEAAMAHSLRFTLHKLRSQGTPLTDDAYQAFLAYHLIEGKE